MLFYIKLKVAVNYFSFHITLKLKTIFITGYGENSTVQFSDIKSTDVFNLMDNLEEISTTKISKITDPNTDNILEHRIQTNWQFMVIITCVLIALTILYLGRCVHRQWISRIHQVSNTNTAVPNAAINESHQIEFFYDEIQNVEYEDHWRYRTIECDDNNGNSTNTSQEKIESVSIIPIRSSLEPSTDEALTGEHVSENTVYENQPEIEIRKSGDLYLTPIL